MTGTQPLEIPKHHFYYLATPYSKYALGIEAAFQDACKVAGVLVKDGYRVYSPIAHTHPIALYGRIDPLDHNVWLPFDATMMEVCSAILVAKMRGWDSSYGVNHEMTTFMDAGKPLFFLDIRPEWLAP